METISGSTVCIGVSVSHEAETISPVSVGDGVAVVLMTAVGASINIGVGTSSGMLQPVVRLLVGKCHTSIHRSQHKWKTVNGSFNTITKKPSIDRSQMCKISVNPERIGNHSHQGKCMSTQVTS